MYKHYSDILINYSDNKTVASSIKLYPSEAYSCTSIYCVTIVGGLVTNFTILVHHSQR